MALVGEQNARGDRGERLRCPCTRPLARKARIIEESGDVGVTGHQTIDGRDVYRFDADEGQSHLDTESDYPPRFELSDGNGTIDFHS